MENQDQEQETQIFKEQNNGIIETIINEKVSVIADSMTQKFENIME